MPGISEKEITKLVHEGWDSEMIRLRLAFAEADSVMKYVKPLVGMQRAHPRMLPTQKSGRWSIKNPPLANFSAECISPECLKRGEVHVATGGLCWSIRDVVKPDPGTYFIHWDWQAIEAKLAAAYSGDDEDLDLFARDADIHTYTYCKMAKLMLPPNVMDPYKSPECAEWRAITGLTHKGVWQRQAGKTGRYSLAYAADERGIHQAKGIDELARQAGLDRKGIELMGKTYLDSKPKLTAWKRRVWDQVMRTQEVRTPLGRRKRLFVTEEEREQYQRTGRATASCKQGLNHLAQGQVACMMNLTIIAIKARWPQCRLAFESHDGWTGVFPEAVDPWPELRGIVERVWEVGEGRTITSTADFERINADGTHGELK